MNNYSREQLDAIIAIHQQACRDSRDQVNIALGMGDHEQAKFWNGIWDDHLEHWEQILRGMYPDNKFWQDWDQKKGRATRPGKLSPRRQQVYDILANGNWSAPATIAGRLNISRQYVHVLMTDIRGMGIKIESRRVAHAKSGKGYQKIFRIASNKAA